MTTDTTGSQPYMPDSVVKRLLGQFGSGCDLHLECDSCRMPKEYLVRGKRLVRGLPQAELGARLGELREQMNRGSRLQVVHRAGWEVPR